MELHLSNILADSLNILHNDNLAIDVETELLQLVCNLKAVHTTVDNTCSAHLCGNGQSNSVELLTESFCISLNLCQLNSLLLQILSKLLLSTLTGNNALTERNQVVAAVARLYINDIVLETKTDDIFFQNDFHYTSSL